MKTTMVVSSPVKEQEVDDEAFVSIPNDYGTMLMASLFPEDFLIHMGWADFPSCFEDRVRERLSRSGLIVFVSTPRR